MLRFPSEVLHMCWTMAETAICSANIQSPLFPFNWTSALFQPAMCLANGQHFPISPGRSGQWDTSRNHHVRLLGKLHKGKQVSWEMYSFLLFSRLPVSYLEFRCHGWRSNSHTGQMRCFEAGRIVEQKEKRILDPWWPWSHHTGPELLLCESHKPESHKLTIWIFCYMQ